MTPTPSFAGFDHGIPGEQLADAAGLSMSRVYQIRDGDGSLAGHGGYRARRTSAYPIVGTFWAHLGTNQRNLSESHTRCYFAGQDRSKALTRTGSTVQS
jgi:hypothetical protein